MTDHSKKGDFNQAALRRPFEPVLSQDSSDRLTRVAKTMFGAADAQIILVENGLAWHSRLPERTKVGPGIQSVIELGEPIWVEDGRSDPRFVNNMMVAGPPYLRFFAAHPIRLGDGSIPGALAVFDTKAHTFDATLANRLGDLAAMIADEWERAATRRAREQILVEREAAVNKFNAVVQAMPVSLVIMDKDLNVLRCSPRWAEEMNQTPEEIIGRSYAELRPAAFCKWGPTISRVLSGETIITDRVRSSTPGSNRWLSVETAPWRDVDGSVGGIIISSHDVTDMVAALESSEKAKRRLTLAMGLSKIHVWEMDYAERKLVKVGDEDNIFSEPKAYDDLFDDPFCTVDPRDLGRVKQDWASHLETGAHYQTDYRVVRSDDKEVWVSCSCDLVTDEQGRPLRLIGALQNITDRKSADQALLQARDDAEMATRAKSAFLATMSHEIRTPLNGVLGMAQAMAADDLPRTQRERLDVIRQSGETLLTILNDILDLSKIEAGKLELEEVEFDLAELCRATHAGFAAVAARKQLSFALVIEENAEGIYRSDSTRVRQILGNLISNALKFTASGSVSVQVRRRGSAVELAVIDSGIGIPAESIGQLFQKFEQVDASTTRKYGGTGLGLAICKQLSEMLGGRIDAMSEEGEGTTFLVTLPLAKIRDSVTSGSVHESIELGSFETALRVLAAEDNSINQLVLKTLLNQAGIDPVIVADGAQALKAWQERDWDLILMDVQMPNMDGPTATAAIRRQESQNGRRRTPILALTANAMSHQIAQYKAAGMDGFVAKPIEVERLFGAMEIALDEAQAAQAATPECSGMNQLI